MHFTQVYVVLIILTGFDGVQGNMQVAKGCLGAHRVSLERAQGRARHGGADKRIGRGERGGHSETQTNTGGHGGLT